MSNSSKRNDTAFPPEFGAFLPPDLQAFLSAKVLLCTVLSLTHRLLIFFTQTIVFNTRVHQFALLINARRRVSMTLRYRLLLNRVACLIRRCCRWNHHRQHTNRPAPNKQQLA